MEGAYFRVDGADLETGEESYLVLQAASVAEAETVARKQGLLIAAVRAASSADWGAANGGKTNGQPTRVIDAVITFEPRRAPVNSTAAVAAPTVAAIATPVAEVAVAPDVTPVEEAGGEVEPFDLKEAEAELPPSERSDATVAEAAHDASEDSATGPALVLSDDTLPMEELPEIAEEAESESAPPVAATISDGEISAEAMAAPERALAGFPILTDEIPAEAVLASTDAADAAEVATVAVEIASSAVSEPGLTPETSGLPLPAGTAEEGSGHSAPQAAVSIPPALPALPADAEPDLKTPDVSPPVAVQVAPAPAPPREPPAKDLAGVAPSEEATNTAPHGAAGHGAAAAESPPMMSPAANTPLAEPADAAIKPARERPSVFADAPLSPHVASWLAAKPDDAEKTVPALNPTPAPRETGRVITASSPPTEMGSIGNLSAARMETPVAKAEVSAAKLEAPAAKVETPVAKAEISAAKLETPAAKVDVSAATLEAPAEKVETAAAKAELPAATKDNPPAIVLEPPTSAPPTATSSPEPVIAAPVEAKTPAAPVKAVTVTAKPVLIPKMGLSSNVRRAPATPGPTNGPASRTTPGARPVPAFITKPVAKAPPVVAPRPADGTAATTILPAKPAAAPRPITAAVVAKMPARPTPTTTARRVPPPTSSVPPSAPEAPGVSARPIDEPQVPASTPAQALAQATAPLTASAPAVAETTPVTDFDQLFSNIVDEQAVKVVDQSEDHPRDEMLPDTSSPSPATVQFSRVQAEARLEPAAQAKVAPAPVDEPLKLDTTTSFAADQLPVIEMKPADSPAPSEARQTPAAGPSPLVLYIMAPIATLAMLGGIGLIIFTFLTPPPTAPTELDKLDFRLQLLAQIFFGGTALIAGLLIFVVAALLHVGRAMKAEKGK